MIDIQSLNITSLSANTELLAKMSGHLIFLQELAATKAMVKKSAKYLREMGWKIYASPVAETIKGSGVGVMARTPLTVIEWKPRSATYKALYSIGRCAIYGIEVQGEAMWFAVIYGATGGHCSQEAAQKTDIAMACLIDELADVVGDPMGIIGDVNAEIEDIPTAWDLVENEGWKDLGEHAHIWGGRKAEPTCQAPNARTATRRDYMLVNAKMFEKGVQG